jgi:ribonuclease VapC
VRHVARNFCRTASHAAASLAFAAQLQRSLNAAGEILGRAGDRLAEILERIDSSALLAILFKAPEKQAFEDLVAGTERCIISADNAHESATVLRIRHGHVAVNRLWQMLAENEIEIIPLDEVQVQAAAIAFDRYGKGIHPKARLNLSDCAAYAQAKSMNAPLLSKDDDFVEPDVQRCR